MTGIDMARALVRPGVSVLGLGPGRWTTRRRAERGASAVEYGLLVAGIAGMIAAVVFVFGGGSTGMFQDSCKTILTNNSVGSCS
ncbi:MAG TPA: Flp family type IVb pilin [Nocardioides sp.]|uniref:Flp family type IVb pilin n=1 Tax=uncultured Nocardioides sp. TaxID=198441 RepID=UPI002638C597|nr:Flp family type IVb pilin [uncultured Nocardioides sp.]HRD61847.1 Flp family type IVb pilin [Nocardioides sp.]HRI95655.1 Flp family type IVb pilin [Nocardioides sp.]HRK45252.1 Flp family type IVb pilin [Nocardioides sp.]